MKKLTAGIFATILGLTAVDAFAAQVASTSYVQGAIQSLDSSATATEGTALTGITVVDGKITSKTEVALPVDTDTKYSAGNGITLTGTTFSANVASVEAGSDNVTVSNVGGKVTVSVAEDQDTTYTAGDGIKLEGDKFSSNIAFTGSLSATTDENGKITVTGTDNNTTYTAGDGIKLENGEFSSDIAFTGSLSAATDENGKITVTGTDNNTTYTAGNGITLSGTEFSANVASVEAGTDNVTVSNVGGKVTVSVAAFENSDVNAGTADAGTNKLLQSVKLENGQLTAVATVDIVDTYVAPKAE